MPKVAVFELIGKQKSLIGYKDKEEVEDDDVVVPDNCDLVADGRYWYNEETKQFVPFGHGFAKPKKPQVTKERVWYLFMKAVIDSEVVEIMPSECSQWLTWYEENLKIREEEELLFRRSR
ncbi:MAG: hypothetical protein HOG49_18235 [Candidatus Scalindua sp.]|jgi:hypothetical protein|nr:hypothetical protein [Candidatus Scalindua sp.]